MTPPPSPSHAHEESPRSEPDTGPQPSAQEPGPRFSIAVVGAGYVGLTAAACFARLGHRVVCTDVDPDKVAGLKQGRVPIHEPGLAELVGEGLASGGLAFARGSAGAAAEADFVYLCVPTPQRSDGSADVSFLEAAAREIGPHLRPGAVVVNKSTVPTGSAALVQRIVGRSDIGVASNPEFLREGSAIGDFLRPDRVVIGAEDRAVAERVAELYEGTGAPVILTDPNSAETVKYAANAFLATKLSFTNAIAAVCEAVGADIGDVLSGMGSDSRIGHQFMTPGPGWGGSCLPKDTRALIAVAEAGGYDFSLLRGVLAVNDEQFGRIVDKVAGRVRLLGARIALLGLAFKAGTDDVRASPAVEIARRLAAAGAAVQAYDPAVPAAAVADAFWITVKPDAYAACEGAAALVVATEWQEFAELDFSRIAALVAERHVIDARNLLDRAEIERHGFTYSGVGLP